MKAIQFILVIAVCFFYFSIDTIAQSEEIKEIKTIQENKSSLASNYKMLKNKKNEEFKAFDAVGGRFGLGFGVLNANSDYGRYGSSFFMDLKLGFAFRKFEIYGSLLFGRGKTKNDIKYLNEIWAAGSQYSSFAFGLAMKYRLFDFGKIGISPDVGLSLLDVGPTISEFEDYPGLRKFGTPFLDGIIHLGFSISYLLPTKTKLSVVSLDYSHYSFTTKSTGDKYANNLQRNSNKLTLRIIFAYKSKSSNYNY